MEALMASVCEAFGLDAAACRWEELSGGHINRTLRVRCVGPEGTLRDLVLQRINTRVFRQPEEVMENIVRVTAHLRSRQPGALTLRYHPARDGRPFFRDAEGGCWRLCDFVPSVSYTSGASLRVVEGAGEAFGTFQQLLADFPADTLHETIPGFHHTPSRYEQLMQAAEQDAAGRASSVREELAWLQSVREEACRLCAMQVRGELPLRVTHNDTKIANVLFSEASGRPLMVIDLDTVMPGLVAYDFGDAIRTAACTAPEDERTLSRVSLDMPRYAAFARGFLSRTAARLTCAELETLPLGCLSVTVEQAVRFLEDYIRGDVYYRIGCPEHNLIRARCQIALAKDMQARLGEMEQVLFPWRSA